ncbi:T9SS type A sorting domain-containing protein [Reichenbachiella sp. MALMAid0571]|uniref:T9SS type A sorting domain-containing protein n=1 Tax=Reichenbachiella sp. MALMAid0571 TaxID=3143939 RepID=UPI0032DE97CB
MKKFLYLGFVFGFLQVFTLNATHIKCGYITAERIYNTSLSYKLIVTLLGDTGSSVPFGGGNIDFGDGTVINLDAGVDPFIRTEVIDAEGRVSLNILEIIHTFSSSGSYIVRFNERNRNAGILNMSNSVDTPFYIESTVVIDPFLGSNNLPYIENVEIPQWISGQSGHFNIAAFDLEGDSISFKLGVPRQSRDRYVDEYRDPVDPSFYPNTFSKGNESQDGKPIFEIDHITGDLIWDAPGLAGEYNTVIIIEEWRKVEGKRYKMSRMYFDFQMIVEPGDIIKPSIVIPENQCYADGEIIEESFLVEGQTNMKVDLYTDAEGVMINDVPIDDYNFDILKPLHELKFTYDSKNASQQYYKVVLKVEAEQDQPKYLNYLWSKAFFFGLSCDEIIEAPQIVTSVNRETEILEFTTYFTQTSGTIYFGKFSLQDASFQLFDINGKSILNKNVQFDQGVSKVMFDALPSGIYIASLEAESNLYKQKVLIR